MTEILSAVREKMRHADLGAFLVSERNNRRYLSGFTGSAGLLLITPARQLLLTDSRYYEQVKQQSPGWELVESGYAMIQHVAELLPELGLEEARIGFEPEHLTVADFGLWQEALGNVELVAAAGFVSEFRVVKTADELADICRAAAIADAALSHVLGLIEPGMTEQEIAWELEVYMRTHGAEALAFDLIIATGPNAALPHATATHRPAALGEVVLIDMGCMVNGYRSDMTRTFCLGQPADPEYLAVWETVDRANRAAVAGLKPGASGKMIDSLARDVITQAGYGDNFGHGLGHGVGLAIHEDPFLSYRTDAVLPAGAVLTVEPGIYLPGRFGVRLEDMVALTAAGPQILTNTPKMPVLNK